jgi:hypothetical protein
MWADMRTPGRPTGYRPEYAEAARNYCELGATTAQLAKYFKVSPRTIDNWIVNFPDFGKAVRETRVFGDEKVWRSIFERANGFYYTEKCVVREGDRERVEIRTRYAKPDLRAAMIWLRNRAQWVEKTGGIANEPLVESQPKSPDVDEPDPVDVDDGVGPDPAFYGNPASEAAPGETGASPSAAGEAAVEPSRAEADTADLPSVQSEEADSETNGNVADCPGETPGTEGSEESTATGLALHGRGVTSGATTIASSLMAVSGRSPHRQTTSA